MVALAAPAHAVCRVALALGLDVSGSVDNREYGLQLNGLATALETPTVQRVLVSMPAAPIYVSVFEWSGQNFQRGLVPWTTLRDEGNLAKVTAQLRRTRRVSAPEATAIGGAMRHGAALLSAGPACWARKLDIS